MVKDLGQHIHISISINLNIRLSVSPYVSLRGITPVNKLEW